MRKNGQRLIYLVIGIVLALFISVFYGPKAKAQQNVGLDFANGYQLVYKVNSSDEAVVKKAAEVLQKRILSYGAKECEYIISGSDVTIQFTGIEDAEAMRKNITKKGELTMRNSDDELIMDASVLNPDAPIALSKSGDDEVIVLNVKDTDTFYQKTASQAAATNKYMVIWVDFEEGTQKYSDESSKSNPAYLAAATVTSGIEGSCYINTHHKHEEAFQQVVLAFSGALPAEVSETAFNEITARFGSFETVWKGIIIGSLAAAGGLVYLFGVAGCTTMLMMLLNAIAYFAFTALLGGRFDGYQLAAYALSTLGGILMMLPVLKEFKLNLLRGRNMQAALDNAMAVNGRTVWEAAVVQIALGGIGMLLFRNDLLQAAGSVLIGGICNLLFFVLWNRFMLKDLVASGYCSNLKLFRVDPAKLPDVQKGEAYVEKESSVNINFAALLKGKLPYVIFAVSLAALLLVSGNAEKTALWKALCVAAIVIALAEVYVLFAYKDRYALMPLFLCFDAMIGIIAAVTGTGKFAGMVLCAVALSAVGLFTLISTYRSEFKGIAREKLNDDKISKFVNGLLGRFTENYCYAAVMFLVLVLALAITAKNMQIFTACVVVRAGAFVSASLLASKGWMEQITKFIERKPKKSNKKKGGKERSETVIFGLNEVK